MWSCCSVLQCVAVCCSVLQCVAVCCSAFHCVVEIQLTCEVMNAVVLQCVTVCCSVLQCVAVCCSVLQCVAVRGHECGALAQLHIRSSMRSSRSESSSALANTLKRQLFSGCMQYEYYRVAETHRMPLVAGRFSQKSH